ncbi:hypothetical protein HPB48_025516 [Haemaphysalis longicornis]|uniref:TRASH domain-containing protein n=1 Tax=Haemaphysalis longicornis TaxID=44386 RepID=A0A9J6H7S1_HAELO|nr:hypothetical protein HPB48_025516 [Haemaphysalis longicornis]
MDTDASITEVPNGEVGVCIKAGPSKQPDDDAESTADNVDSTTDSPKAGSITNGCPDADSKADDVVTTKSVNGTSEVNAGGDDGSCLDKPLSEADASSVVEDSSKGNSEVAECGGDSQQDSIADEDGEKAEPMEATGEDAQLPPGGQSSEPVKNKEANSEESTPSSTPGRKSKKKSKKVSKLSIMHAIAKRLSGQAKGGEAQNTTKAEPPRADGAKGLRYQVLYQGKTQFLCSDDCFKAFRSMQKLAPKKPATERDTCAQCQKEHAVATGFYSSFGPCKPLCSADCLRKHNKAHSPKRQCAQCQTAVELSAAAEQQQGRPPSGFLVWETMEFCGEECLRQYQSANGSRCSHCSTPVNQLSLGKYCVRFGADIRQFCSGKCLEEFKRGLKVCCLCQKDLSKQKEGFLAPVGEKGHFKDFCSQLCLERYERMNAFNAANLVPHKCTACDTESTTKYQVEHSSGAQRLCSDVCVSKFRCANKIKQVVCENCHSLFDSEPSQPPIFLYHDNVCQQFCNKACVNLFVLSHRKIVPCAWCKVKKYNFDMIERVELSGSHLFCSLNCLNLFRVNQNASSARVIRCDCCHTMQPAQYHLTMSDASIRNFCCYKCVIAFQNQFKNLPVLTTSSPTVSPATMARAQAAPGAPAAGGTPVISNIRSLAPATKSPVIPTSMQSASEMNSGAAAPAPRPPPPALTAMPKVVSVPVQVQQSTVVQDKILAPSPHIVAAMASSSSARVSSPSAAAAKDVGAGHTEREVIIQLPFPKLLRNKALLCRPQVAHKATLCKPEPGDGSSDALPGPVGVDTGVQAELGAPGAVRLVPVPVPVYVPVPLHMFAHAVPSPLPIPIPVPVPIFLPTTCDTTDQIREMLREATEQMQNHDKFDEVLLAIARSLADSASPRPVHSENKGGPTRPKSAKRAASDDEADTQLPTKKTRTALDDEVEPGEAEPVEIESEETAPEETEPAKTEAVEKESAEVDSVDVNPVEMEPAEMDSVENRARTVTRGGVLIAAGPFVPCVFVEGCQATWLCDLFSCAPRQPAAAVSAWQDWVHKKNAELEKGSLSGKRQLKLFKTNLLSMSPEELNHALSLFIKEVQLAEGTASSPCRFYLQCLAVQDAGNVLCAVELEDRINADTNVIAHEELSDRDIIKSVRDKEESDEGEVPDLQPPPATACKPDAFDVESNSTCTSRGARITSLQTPQYEMFTGCFHSVFSQANNDAAAAEWRPAESVVALPTACVCFSAGAHWGGGAVARRASWAPHSPLVLLNTLLYFNLKYFGLHTVDQHLGLTPGRRLAA